MVARPEASLLTPEATPEPDAQPPLDDQVSNIQAASTLLPPVAQMPVAQTPKQAPDIQAASTLLPPVAQTPKQAPKVQA